MKKGTTRVLIRNLILELVIYGILLVVYFFAVLRFLGNFLSSIFENHLTLYAILALILIVVQGVLLESITSFMIRMLSLDGKA